MKIFRMGAYESFYDMPLSIDWLLTKRCNYRCTYCFHYGYNRPPPPQLPFSTLEQLKNAVDNIASLNRPWYDIILTGGEPSIHPHFFDLLCMLRDTLKDRLNEILVITNGSRDLNLYRKIAELAKTTTISMQVSIHTDHVDMPHFLKLIETLSRDIDLYIPLMFNPAKREEVQLIHDIMFEYRKRFYFRLEVMPLRMGDQFDPRYTPEDFEWLKAANERFNELDAAVKFKYPPPKRKARTMHMFHDIEENGERKIIETTNSTAGSLDGMLNFFGMYCTSHTAILRIEETGTCRGLICYCDPNTCNIYEKGSLKASRDKMIHAIKCPRPLCGCETSNYAPKFASQEEAASFLKIIDGKQQILFDQVR